MKYLLSLIVFFAGTAQAADGDNSLRTVMQNLSMQMQRGTDAISREDWPAIELIAAKIAQHPSPPAVEKMRILRTLGSDASRFRELDHQTHAAAELLAESAKKGDGAAVISAYARVQSTCMSCHQSFRTRIRTALATQ